ncbi:MAG: response regulator transcription factor [Chloroflexi bacterium]|nr:response regulator transcription factor [Chloroflexota bacterium]
MAGPIRVLIADDHPVVRTGLLGMLAAQPEFKVVGEAVNGREAIELADRPAPDVVLMDLAMPELDGVAATSRIRERNRKVQVLVLTTYDGDADILRAVESGAIGYMLKDAPREDLFRAIRAAAKGESFLAPAVAARLMGRMRAPAEETLSAREIQVLTLVSQGASNKEIGRQLHISEATVKTHLIHIFEKLGVNDRTQAVTVAVQRGIVRLGE